VRHNLRVKHGDVITVHPCPDIKYVSCYHCSAISRSNKFPGQAYSSPSYRRYR
jgi:hypothetical protein